MPQFLNLTKQNLKYIDALTYVTIRSFHNSTTGKCFPAYETIAAKCKMSRGFIIESINRLEKANFIKVTRSEIKHISNKYDFPKCKYFEQIPYGLFDTELTGNEKGMLLCFRQLFIHGPLKCSDTISKIAEYLGVTYRTVHRQYQTLLAKGYIEEHHKIRKGGKKGYKILSLSNKINWNDYQDNVIEMEKATLKLKLA